MNQAMNDEKTVQIAIDEGFKIWLDPQPYRGWYTDLIGGKKMRGKDAEEQIQRQISVMERIEELIKEEAKAQEQEEEAQADQEPDISENLKQYIRTHNNVKTKTIKCVDCDRERIIKVQDAFQVKRCISCQKKYRNRKRTERKQARAKAEKKAQGE